MNGGIECVNCIIRLLEAFMGILFQLFCDFHDQILIVMSSIFFATQSSKIVCCEDEDAHHVPLYNRGILDKLKVSLQVAESIVKTDSIYVLFSE
jgi:hypothetical protein